MPIENGNLDAAKLHHFSQQISGVARVYDAPIEHFEHAVLFYKLGVANETLDRVQYLALWKASIIFCALCIEALWKQIGRKKLKGVGKNRSNKFGEILAKQVAFIGKTLDEKLERFSGSCTHCHYAPA